MKKKKLLLACLIAAALAGCGNHNGSMPPDITENATDPDTMKEETKSDVRTAQNGKEDAEGNGSMLSGTGEEAALPENSMEDGMEAETEGSISSETKSGTSSEAEEATEGGAVSAFVFGDRSTMDNQAGGRELPIYCVDTEEKKVALSFDAAWGNEDTEKILAILKEHDLRVTFFMTGGWVENYPDDVKAILEAGHDLGNHSENHKNMSELSDEEKREEILSVHRKVKEITGYDMFLFRPPYGDYDNALIDVLKDCEYYAIQWDVDSLDWKNEGVDAILETVTEHKNLGNGSIILCHNGAEYTAQALDELIDGLEAEGYAIVPVSELIYKDNYHMNYEGRQIRN